MQLSPFASAAALLCPSCLERHLCFREPESPHLATETSSIRTLVYARRLATNCARVCPMRALHGGSGAARELPVQDAFALPIFATYGPKQCHQLL